MIVRVSCLLLCLVGLPQGETKPAIPQQIVGSWIVLRELPTKAVSCWSREDAKKVVGSKILYSDKVFRWNKTTVENPSAGIRTVTAQQFHDENSGIGPRGAEITLQDLGIQSDSVVEIEIKHRPAHLFDETSEIPGDDVIVKDATTIVFPVCNTYFEARRVQNDR